MFGAFHWFSVANFSEIDFWEVEIFQFHSNFFVVRLCMLVRFLYQWLFFGRGGDSQCSLKGFKLLLPIFTRTLFFPFTNPCFLKFFEFFEFLLRMWKRSVTPFRNFIERKSFLFWSSTDAISRFLFRFRIFPHVYFSDLSSSQSVVYHQHNFAPCLHNINHIIWILLIIFVCFSFDSFYRKYIDRLLVGWFTLAHRLRFWYLLICSSYMVDNLIILDNTE